jgi:hypothetical protein
MHAWGGFLSSACGRNSLLNGPPLFGHPLITLPIRGDKDDRMHAVVLQVDDGSFHHHGVARKGSLCG